MSIGFVQGKDYNLAGSGITSIATTIILQSFQTPDGTPLVTADFGTLGYATIEPGTVKEEQITFTTVTQNGNGTATLTGVTRGVRFVAPYDGVPALGLQHAGGVIFRITNTAKFYTALAAISNPETITGRYIFP